MVLAVCRAALDMGGMGINAVIQLLADQSLRSLQMHALTAVAGIRMGLPLACAA